MSKGTRVYTLRIDEATMEQISGNIERANEYRREVPYTLTSWILAAIREKMAHGKRSRKPRAKRAKQTAE